MPHHINSIFIINTQILYIYICYTFPSHARLIHHSQKTITVNHDFAIYDTALSRTVPSSITKDNHNSSLLYNLRDSIVAQMGPSFIRKNIIAVIHYFTIYETVQSHMVPSSIVKDHHSKSFFGAMYKQQNRERLTHS